MKCLLYLILLSADQLGWLTVILSPFHLSYSDEMTFAQLEPVA